MPHPSEIDFRKVELMLNRSIQMLERNDRELYESNVIEEARTYSELHRAIDSKLHEVTINHRLAHYIECCLPEFELDRYSVDIEYNRFYEGEKVVNMSGSNTVVRPDIIIHTRRNNNLPHQHYLIIEAKKGRPSANDIAKIKSLLLDDNYRYLFGATVSYCSDPLKVTCTLYYCNHNGSISSRPITTLLQ